MNPDAQGELFAKYHDALAAETDRGAALVAAALLEDALAQAIKNRLLPPVGADRLFKGPNAPLGTFAAKIHMACRLGIIVPGLARALDEFREIRNAFAHQVGVQRFWDTTLKAKIEKMLRINPKILDFIVSPLSVEEVMSDPIHLRCAFDRYYAYVAMRIEARAQEIEPIKPFKV